MQRDLYQEMFAAEDHHWWFVARRRILDKILNTWVIDRSGAILEIGCGTGGNLALLSSYGSVLGVEMDDEALELAKGRKICPVQKGALPDAVFFYQKFDLICLLDVLEHIADDLGALRALRNQLNPKGKVLLTVPANKFLWSSHDVEMHHHRRYRRRELLALFRQAGFRIGYSTYFNTLLFPFIAGARMVGRLGGRAAGSDVAMTPKIINPVLREIFAAEHYLLPAISLPFGVSLLVLAENDD